MRKEKREGIIYDLDKAGQAIRGVVDRLAQLVASNENYAMSRHDYNASIKKLQGLRNSRRDYQIEDGNIFMGTLVKQLGTGILLTTYELIFHHIRFLLLDLILW